MKNLRVSEPTTNGVCNILFDVGDIVCVLIKNNGYNIVSQKELLELLAKNNGYIDPLTQALEFKGNIYAERFLEDFLPYYNMYLLRGGN